MSDDKYPDMSAMYSVMFAAEDKLKEEIEKLKQELDSTRKALDEIKSDIDEMIAQSHDIGERFAEVVLCNLKNKIEQINQKEQQ